MAERLQAWGIPTQQGFDPAHLDPDTDLVIVGNVCRRDNPEAQAALQMGLKVMSFRRRWRSSSSPTRPRWW